MFNRQHNSEQNYNMNKKYSYKSTENVTIKFITTLMKKLQGDKTREIHATNHFRIFYFLVSYLKNLRLI
jgi:hypothetical protein